MHWLINACFVIRKHSCNWVLNTLIRWDFVDSLGFCGFFRYGTGKKIPFKFVFLLILRVCGYRFYHVFLVDLSVFLPLFGVCGYKFYQILPCPVIHSWIMRFLDLFLFDELPFTQIIRKRELAFLFGPISNCLENLDLAQWRDIVSFFLSHMKQPQIAVPNLHPFRSQVVGNNILFRRTRHQLIGGPNLRPCRRKSSP